MDKKLIIGDSTKKNLFKEEFIDLTITSPPYNVDINYKNNNDSISYTDYTLFTKKWLTNIFKWTKSTGRICLNIPLDKNKCGKQSISADITTIAKKIGWKYQTTIIWNEQNISRRTAWGSWLSASAPHVITPVEIILVLYKDNWKKSYKGTSDISKKDFIQWTNGLWNFNGESKKRIGHPAPFPKELPYRCIKLYSYIGDLIFDPFLGSGTTTLVAKKLNRKYIGVDLNQDYIFLANKRIKNTKYFEKTCEKY